MEREKEGRKKNGERWTESLMESEEDKRKGLECLDLVISCTHLPSTKCSTCQKQEIARKIFKWSLKPWAPQVNHFLLPGIHVKDISAFRQESV